MKAVLLLEDGRMFEGRSFGAKGIRCGEAVFNTSMAGYQEILTDPSYTEQIITMTYPLIGNYGTSDMDVESNKIHASGFIVKENCPYPSNLYNQKSLNDYLKENKVVGIEGIDTRALTRHLRDKGAMRAIIAAGNYDKRTLMKKLKDYPGLVGRDIVSGVSVKKKTPFTHSRSKKVYKVAALDFGIKTNILRMLDERGCKLTVLPSKTSAEDILKGGYDGLFLSNGPGDPAAVTYAVDTIKDVLGKLPIFGICLGHQLLSLAMGGTSYKLKFGHRGANHPVKNLKTGKIEITSQNHGFCVDLDSLGKDVELTHINLNDNTLEGIRCKKQPAFSVQYHPESSPGPHDSAYLFDEFLALMKKHKSKKKK